MESVLQSAEAYESGIGLIDAILSLRTHSSGQVSIHSFFHFIIIIIITLLIFYYLTLL